ncbi:MAG: hypothetical protein EOO11_14130 [Chitinophagaceae bacterium]|nr:MAG: hypothetical protein EOO11_14130 [Chitinophagaceae bacterium]
MRPFLLFLLLACAGAARAQVDSFDTRRGGLNIAALRDGKASFAIYWEDSLGRRLGSADIWDRSIALADSGGQRRYRFSWQVWRKDTLVADVRSTGTLPALQPLRHEGDWRGRGAFAYAFADTVVTVPEGYRRNARDSAFRVVLDPPGFAFPMDLELFPLLPFRKEGQRFAMAFYEPGSPKSAYYPLTVAGTEELQVPGGGSVRCWLLRIDYAPGSYATFWISDKGREVLKMREYFRGRYRVKLRLY